MSTKGLTHDVYNLIYNSEKLEATHVSVNSWDDRQIKVYPHNGIHIVESTVKKKKLPIHTGMDESQKQYTEQKKPKWVPSMWLYITMGIIDVCGLGLLTRKWQRVILYDCNVLYLDLYDGYKGV